MTATIFTYIFLIFTGYAIGSLCVGWHPFKMLLVLFISIFLYGLMEEHQTYYYSIPFFFGFIFNWDNPLRLLISIFESIGMNFSLRFHLKNRQREFEAHINSQKQQAEDDLHAQSEELYRQRQEAEEELKRQAENLKRERESFNNKKQQFHKEQQQGQSHQNDKGQESSKIPNPSRLSDAYDILGVKAGASLSECKEAYRRLMSLYHPDKIMQLTGSRRQQAEEEAKLINVAWETVKKNLK